MKITERVIAMKRQIGKKTAVFILICAVIAVCGWYFFHTIFDEIDTVKVTDNAVTQTEEVKNGQTIEINCADDAVLRRVSLWCPENDRLASGYLTASAYASDGHLVAQQKVYYPALSDKAYCTVLSNFQIRLRPDKPATIRIQFVLEGYTPFYVNVTQDGKLDATLNGFCYSSNNYTLMKGYWILFSCVSAAVLLAYLMLFVFHAKLHWIFAAVGLPLILAFEIALPITSVPDEYDHYQQAYRISDRLMGNSCSDFMITARKEDLDSLESQIYWVGKPPDKETYLELWHAVGKSAKDTDLVTKQIGRLSWDGPAYCAGGLGITLGRLLKLNGITTFYLARLAASLVYLLLCTLAIRMAPVRKGFFALASISPMALHLGSSVSYDLGMFPMAYLFVACWLRLMAKPKGEIYSWKDWLPFALSIVLLVPSKVYLFFCLFALFVPKSRFGDSRRAYAYRWGTFFASCALMLVLTGSNAAEYLSKSNQARYTLGYMYHHIRSFFLLSLSTLKNAKEVTMGELVGSGLAWHNVHVDYFWIYFFYILLALACIWQEDENNRIPRLSPKYKWGFAAVALLVFAGVNYAAMTWTLVGVKWFQGIQGRYFLPLLPVILLLARQDRILAKKPTDRRIFFCGTCAEFFVLLEILTNNLA